MAEFKFDIKKSAQENIDLFLVLMGFVDEEMTKLLAGNMDKMTPFPDQGPQRTAARVAWKQRFNSMPRSPVKKLTNSTGQDIPHSI